MDGDASNDLVTVWGFPTTKGRQSVEGNGNSKHVLAAISKFPLDLQDFYTTPSTPSRSTYQFFLRHLPTTMPAAATACFNVLRALVLFILFQSVLAVKGRQSPNTVVSVPTPFIASTLLSRLSLGGTGILHQGDDCEVDDEHDPPGCNCRFSGVGRTVTTTPAECIDYCVWRWAWY